MSPLPKNPGPSAAPVRSRLAVLGYRLLDLMDRAWRKWHRTLDQAAVRRQSRGR